MGRRYAVKMLDTMGHAAKEPKHSYLETVQASAKVESPAAAPVKPSTADAKVVSLKELFKDDFKWGWLLIERL